MVTATYLTTLLATATLTLARTPPGFAPAVNTDLIVEFSGVIPLNGIEIPRNSTTTQPRIGTLAALPGRSYSIFMIDLDIPVPNPPTTLLHWLQTSLVPARTATRIRTPTGELSVFLLENGTSPVAPLVSYFGPNPPARLPLAHRYVQLLVDTSDAAANAMSVLTERAKTGRGFEVDKVLQEAALEGKAVAGSWLVVRNPGPVMNATMTTTGGAAGPAATGVAVPAAAAGRGGAALGGLVGAVLGGLVLLL